MYIEKVLDLWVQLMKNGGKNKCCVYNYFQCIYIYIYICVYIDIYIHTLSWINSLISNCPKKVFFGIFLVHQCEYLTSAAHLPSQNINDQILPSCGRNEYQAHSCSSNKHKVHFGSTPMNYHRPGVYFDSCLFISSSWNDENKYITQIVHSEGRLWTQQAPWMFF